MVFLISRGPTAVDNPSHPQSDQVLSSRLSAMFRVPSCSVGKRLNMSIPCQQVTMEHRPSTYEYGHLRKTKVLFKRAQANTEQWNKAQKHSLILGTSTKQNIDSQGNILWIHGLRRGITFL